MSKQIIINNGGHYDDQSYTDERHYHYEDGKSEGRHEENEKTSPVFLRDERGVKIDIIRVLNTLYELGKFTGADGSRLTKKVFFTTMGRALNVDLSNYDKDLSRSTSDSTSLDKHLRIFDDMRRKMEDIWSSK